MGGHRAKVGVKKKAKAAGGAAAGGGGDDGPVEEGGLKDPPPTEDGNVIDVCIDLYRLAEVNTKEQKFAIIFGNP